uniref:Phycoerythrin alpha-subunit 2 n=2 Tax=Proteomonas sulcata TaxID=77928 RepID=A0A067YRY3_9CRYP|nr:phycoerythrin alpha-subunit 2 [Proteomonas sulcata]
MNKVIAFAGLVASATAFAPTGFTPALRSGATSVSMAMDKSAKAPVITIFDHRGCSRAPKEYTGSKASGQDDEMMVKAQSVKIAVSDGVAESVLKDSLSVMHK